MSLLRLFKSEILDKYVRENFQRIENHAKDDLLGNNRFIFIEKELALATYPATFELPHTLGFQPKDVIQLSVSPDDTVVTWNTDSNTRTTYSVTIDQACTVRAFIGRYGDT